MNLMKKEIWVYMEGADPLAVFNSRRDALSRIVQGIPLTPREGRMARWLLEANLTLGHKFQIVGNLETKQKDRQIVLVSME